MGSENHSAQAGPISVFYTADEKPVQTFSLLDFEKVSADLDGAKKSTTTAIKTYRLDRQPTILSAPVVIAGGGMGGVAAALALGADVTGVLLEETSWLGGQLSSQGVSALDENKYVESTGACSNYLQLREKIRDYYRQTDNLIEPAKADPLLNPGTCWVTRLAFEPEPAVKIIEEMLAPQVQSGTLKILKRTKVVAVKLNQEDAKIKALLAIEIDSGNFIEIHSAVTIDATELGDLMPLAQIPYQTGSDSRWVTGEEHAPEIADPDNVQDFTYPFILEYFPGENHTINKPKDYDQFFAAGKFDFDGYKMFAESDDVKIHSDGTRQERHLLPFWTYRRLIDKNLFKELKYRSDLAMINWDSNDLRGKNIIDKSLEEQRDYLALAKRLSLGFLYWLQTEAAVDGDGEKQKKGYPGLKLAFNVLGTEDGFSKYPYIREARRLAAKTMIVEADIVEATNPQARARIYEDTCGIGLYPVDIHGRQEIAGAAQQTRPFQIPLTALISDYCPNFIAGCKNIGVTHITNGAYRLHPIEWAIGTAAGTTAKLAVQKDQTPLQICEIDENLLALQIALVKSGAPIFWFDDLPPTHSAFAAAQLLTAIGVMPYDEASLSFGPEETIACEQIETRIAGLSERLPQLLDWQSKIAPETGTGSVSRAQLVEALFSLL